jgi:hypothetical protein
MIRKVISRNGINPVLYDAKVISQHTACSFTRCKALKLNTYLEARILASKAPIVYTVIILVGIYLSRKCGHKHTRKQEKYFPFAI